MGVLDNLKKKFNIDYNKNIDKGNYVSEPKVKSDEYNAWNYLLSRDESNLPKDESKAEYIKKKLIPKLLKNDVIGTGIGETAGMTGSYFLTKKQFKEIDKTKFSKLNKNLLKARSLVLSGGNAVNRFHKVIPKLQDTNVDAYMNATDTALIFLFRYVNRLKIPTKSLLTSAALQAAGVGIRHLAFKLLEKKLAEFGIMNPDSIISKLIKQTAVKAEYHLEGNAATTLYKVDNGEGIKKYLVLIDNSSKMNTDAIMGHELGHELQDMGYNGTLIKHIQSISKLPLNSFEYCIRQLPLVCTILSKNMKTKSNLLKGLVKYSPELITLGILLVHLLPEFMASYNSIRILIDANSKGETHNIKASTQLLGYAFFTYVADLLESGKISSIINERNVADMILENQ